MVERVRADAPLVVEGAQHFVNRNYREGGHFQWVRETLVNSIEAQATRVEFGTEWQGVREHGVYRRTIADNGIAMTPDELVGFFRTYGGSGKPIGGEHGNFGIGAKCALFPWNPAGVVVVSWHPDFDEPSMIWVRKNRNTDEYGLRTWDTPEGGENVVVATVDEDLGIDWSLVKPDWIEDHGTVIVLLGDDLEQDTVLGDPNRKEGGVPGLGIVNYLNRRMWDLDNVTVTVDEYRTDDRSKWPRTSSVSVKSELQFGRRKIEGAKYYINYPVAEEKKAGRVAASGTVPLLDGSQVDWYLWEGGGRDGIRNAAKNGFMAAMYAPDDDHTFPELFDIEDHPSRFRAFGISENEVRKRLWLVIRPPLTESNSYGVYMSSDRNRLLIKGGPKAGDPLPWEDWAIEFADSLPTPIVEAINAARAGTDDAEMDDTWRERLAERFGRRWRHLRLVLDREGDTTTDADQPGGEPRATGDVRRRPHRRGGETPSAAGRDGQPLIGTSEGGSDAARQRRVVVGLPKHEWRSEEGMFEPGILAVWNAPSQANPDGLIQLNAQHPVIREELTYWAAQYPPHLEEDVIKVVKNAYAQMAVATVTHIEALKPHLERREVAEQMRTPEALTASLLGLVGAAAIIGPTLGGVVGRRRAGSPAESVSS